MYSPEPAGADGGGNRRRPDADDRGDADARDDRRQRQRQLDLPEQLPRRHAERHAGLDERRVDGSNAGDRRAHDRQQRVDDEHGDRHARAEAADERQRQQEAEHRQARHRLRGVDEPDDRRPEARPPRGEDAKGHADRDRDHGRDGDEEEVLEEQGAELGAVRRPELEHPHACPRPCSAVAASTSGSSIARTLRVAARRDRGRRGERHQHAVGEHADPRRQRQRFGHVVRDDDDRLADRRLDAPELAVQLAARDGIERAERLVHQQNRRIGRERARHADALALAARQLLRPPRGEVIGAEADERQQLLGRASRSAPRPSRAAAARRRCCRERSGAERGRRPAARSRCGGGGRTDPRRPPDARGRPPRRHRARAAG